MSNLLFSLGKHYVSDFSKEFDYSKLQKYDLGLELNSDGAVHLTEQPPASQMWGKYWYRTGMNKSMVSQMQDIVTSIIQRIHFNDNDTWLDIACNDGTMFKFMPDNIDKVGIDPADDTYFNESSKVATVKQDFFSKDAYYSIRDKKAKVITTIAMFYDLQDPDKFIRDIDEVLEQDGLWVIQISYTPLMLKQLAFDNICHEHYFYYSLKSLKSIFERNGFVITDVSLNDTNGGSCRVFIQRKNDKRVGSRIFQDICDYRIESILLLEDKYDVSKTKIWNEFYTKLNTLKIETIKLLTDLKSQGKKVFGFGASTKGNTLLQYFGIDSDLLSCIVESSTYKFGLVTVGSNIPIISEEEMLINKPDYLFILPWHFIDNFLIKEKELLNAGVKFIVPCPELKIYGN